MSISEKGWIQTSSFHCAKDSSLIVLVVVDGDDACHAPVEDDRIKIRSSYANGSLAFDSVAVPVMVEKFKPNSLWSLYEMPCFWYHRFYFSWEHFLLSLNAIHHGHKILFVLQSFSPNNQLHNFQWCERSRMEWFQSRVVRFFRATMNDDGWCGKSKEKIKNGIDSRPCR